MRIFYTLLTCLLAINAIAQCPGGWSTQISGLPAGVLGNNYPQVINDHDGNTIVLLNLYSVDSILVQGQIFPVNPGMYSANSGIALFKFDTQGNLMWANIMPGTGSNIVRDLDVDDENNIYVAGRISSTLTINGVTYEGPPNNKLAHLLVKLNPNGDTEWVEKQEYTGSVCNKIDVIGEYIYYIMTFDDSMKVAGHTFYATPTNESLSHDLLFGRLDKDGNFSTAYLIGGDGYCDVLGEMKCGERGCLIQGSYAKELEYQNMHYTTPHNSYYQFYQLFLSYSGELLWSNTSENSPSILSFPFGIDFIKDSAFVAGSSPNQFTVDNLTIPATQSKDIFIGKVSLNTGEFGWLKSFSGSSADLIDNLMASDDAVYMSGFTYSPELDYQNFHFNNAGESATDGFIISLDEFGNYRCAKEIHGDGIQEVQKVYWKNHYVYSIVSFENTIELDGDSFENIGNFDILVSKTCLPCDSALVSPNNISENTAFNVQIYPNPIIDNTTVTLQNALKNGYFELVDALGRTVRSESIQSKQFTIYKGDLPAGVYFLNVYEDEIKLGSWRIAVGE